MVGDGEAHLGRQRLDGRRNPTADGVHHPVHLLEVRRNHDQTVGGVPPDSQLGTDAGVGVLGRVTQDDGVGQRKDLFGVLDATFLSPPTIRSGWMSLLWWLTLARSIEVWESSQ